MSTTFSTDSDQTFSFFWINFTCTSVEVSGWSNYFIIWRERTTWDVLFAKDLTSPMGDVFFYLPFSGRSAPETWQQNCLQVRQALIRRLVTSGVSSGSADDQSVFLLAHEQRWLETCCWVIMIIYDHYLIRVNTWRPEICNHIINYACLVRSKNLIRVATSGLSYHVRHRLHIHLSIIIYLSIYLSIYPSIHLSLSTCIYTLGMMQAGKTVHMSSTVEVFGCSLGWHYHYLPRWNLSYTFIYLNPWRMNSSSHSYGGVLNIGESRKPMPFQQDGRTWMIWGDPIGNLLIWKTRAKKQLALHPISSARKITSASAWHAAFSPSDGSWSMLISRENRDGSKAMESPSKD